MAADTLEVPPLSTAKLKRETSGSRTPLDTILMTAGGYCVPRTLHVIAEIGVADSLGAEPMDIGQLAQDTGTNADVLGRMLRLLSAHGIFEADGSSVRHNEPSRLLRSDHPQSARALARMLGLEYFWSSFLSLEHSLRTGKPAAAEQHAEGVWEWLSERPQANAIFNESMIAKSHAQIASVIDAYDFSRFGTVADIGGGRGHLLDAVTDKCPRVKGILFDLPHVIEDAKSSGVSRLELVGGDFFADELPAADAYVLMEVIHDWDDEHAQRILDAIARAAPRGATLLLVEQLIPEGNEPNWVSILDIHMLALFAAKQRNEAEYQRLLKRAGFEIRRVIPTFSGASIIDAVRR
jgi:hypothetical protein